MSTTNPQNELLQQLRLANHVTVITGAGMSAESGVPTFRDASDGLWAQFDAYKMASPEGWKEDKNRVWAWYEWRRKLVKQCLPHAGHFAIAQLSEALSAVRGGKVGVSLITQNVDDLHERAGFVGAMHVHGSLFAPRCSACGRPGEFLADSLQEACTHLPPPKCGHCGGFIRPGVVWFNEGLDTRLWSQAVRSVQECDVLLVVGTSGVVRPVSGLPQLAKEHGVWVCEVNPNATELSSSVHLAWRVSAAEGLPALVQQL